jgi:hypothetical protein
MDELDFNNYNKTTLTQQHQQHQQQQVLPTHLWTKNNQQQQFPSTITSLPNLIFDSLDGFCFVLNSSGLIQFISENVINYIKYSQVSYFNS